MATYEVVVGTTNDIKFQLLDNGAPIDLTGVTVTLLLEDRTGKAVPLPGTVTVTDSANGKVSLTPTNTSVFTGSKGPYYARWKLVDFTGKIGFVPSSTRDVWQIIGT
jgi:hypothetical protein